MRGWVSVQVSQGGGFFGGAGGGGGACLSGRLLTLPSVCFLSPIPPTPFPGGEGGDYSYLMQGAPPLASPGLSRTGHRSRGANHAPSGGLSPGGAYSTSQAGTSARGVTRAARGAGGLAVFRKRARAVAPSILNSRHVLGGLGDSFKSPPAFPPFPPFLPFLPFLPFPSFPVTASMGCRAGGRRG